MNKRLFLVIVAFLVCAGVAGFLAFRSPVASTGYGGVREPTIPIPDSIGVTRYYDAESDVLCWIFTKRLEGGGFDVTSSCLPREVTDY